MVEFFRKGRTMTGDIYAKLLQKFMRVIERRWGENWCTNLIFVRVIENKTFQVIFALALVLNFATLCRVNSFVLAYSTLKGSGWKDLTHLTISFHSSCHVSWRKMSINASANGNFKVSLTTFSFPNDLTGQPRVLAGTLLANFELLLRCLKIWLFCNLYGFPQN